MKFSTEEEKSFQRIFKVEPGHFLRGFLRVFLLIILIELNSINFYCFGTRGGGAVVHQKNGRR